MNPTNQWLYAITDTGKQENMSVMAEHLGEGDNVAFMFNASNSEEDSRHCVVSNIGN